MDSANRGWHGQTKPMGRAAMPKAMRGARSIPDEEEEGVAKRHMIGKRGKMAAKKLASKIQF